MTLLMIYRCKKRTKYFDDEVKDKLLHSLETEYGIELLEEADENQPYIEGFRIELITKYNPNYGDNRLCKCGHPYHRHFDSYENNFSVGCKYCACRTFVEKKE